MITKICTACEESKEISHFYPSKSYSDGYSYFCISCFKEKARVYRNANSKRLNENLKKWRDENRDKIREQSRLSYERRKIKYKSLEYLEKYRKVPKNKVEKRSNMLKNRYGITLEDYNLMLTSQNNVCAVCKKEEVAIDKRTGNTRNLAVDHCHSTGRIRGLLCTCCNTAIGSTKENVEILNNIISYLGKTNGS